MEPMGRAMPVSRIVRAELVWDPFGDLEPCRTRIGYRSALYMLDCWCTAGPQACWIKDISGF